MKKKKNFTGCEHRLIWNVNTIKENVRNIALAEEGFAEFDRRRDQSSNASIRSKTSVPGIDNCPYMFYSELYPQLKGRLLAEFNSTFRTVSLPYNHRTVPFNTIPKSRRDKTKINNYRLIAIINWRTLSFRSTYWCKNTSYYLLDIFPSLPIWFCWIYTN